MQNNVQNPIQLSGGQVSVNQANPPYMQNPQCVQVPNYSGVNIQIFNPSVGTPYCYPSNYYTNQWGNSGVNQYANNNISNTMTTQANPAANPAANTASNAAYAADTGSAANAAYATNTTTTTNNTTNTTTVDKKKTEKRKIVQLTNEYIKNLEDYLNNQDKEIRMMGAKEVAARLEEDDSRKDNKALTALINKMLQDPYQPIRFLALAMLDARYVTGDDYTVQVLKNMQTNQSGYGQDSLQASQVLLKMSGKQIEKEFEVQPKKENK